MSTQPLALRLADALEISSNHGIRREAAAELRRLHAQRDALTEEEIKKLLIEHAGMTVVFSEVDLRFARAVERAHGIGEQQ